MRPFVIIVFCCVCTMCARAQHVLHERLGPTIDTTERAYFALFPTVDGFHSATSKLANDGAVLFVITRLRSDVSSDTTMRVDSSTAAYLTKYIDNYHISQRSNKSAKRTVQWERLEGLAAFGPIIDSKPGYGRTTDVVTKDNRQISGRLLFVSDASVVLWNSDSPYDWEELTNHAVVVRRNELHSIDVDRGGGLWPWAGYGALYGSIGVIPLMLIPPAPHSNGDPIAARVYIAIGSIVGGAILGAVAGLIRGPDIELNTNDSPNAYSDALIRMQKEAIYPAYPPPELSRMVTP